MLNIPSMNLESSSVLEHYNKDTYVSYCGFLKKKYGKVPGNYFINDKKNTKITRGKEGLFIHHIYETKYDMLCNWEHCVLFHPEEALEEAQEAENLVYCNLLEHYLLHLLIEKDGYRHYGCSGGIFIWIGPELNDVYSGFTSKLTWKNKSYDLILGEKEDYIKLVQQFSEDSKVPLEDFCKSFNAEYGWDEKKNEPLYNEIKKLSAK